jgi:hypothetical protein
MPAHRHFDIWPLLAISSKLTFNWRRRDFWFFAAAWSRKDEILDCFGSGNGLGESSTAVTQNQLLHAENSAFCPAVSEDVLIRRRFLQRLNHFQEREGEIVGEA